MRLVILILLLVLLLASQAPAADRGVVAVSQSPHANLKALDLDEVRWSGGFWGRWYEANKSSITPTIWEALNNPANSATYLNFLIVTGKMKGNVARTDWSDGDVYKYLETVASIYPVTKDPKLDRHMDEMIAVIAQAQEPDGYLSTPVKLKGYRRWENLNHHELYNMGHLMTAACIHHRATGKDSFLNVARKVADYLYTVFQPRPKELAHFGFNPSNIMGLAELYRTTRNPKYLELAGIFVDMRGSQPGGTDQNQTRMPLRKETEAVGHAVTACYLYGGAADVYIETGETALADALQRIWMDMATRKVYVTGAVGNLYHGSSRHRQPVHEAFGIPYELPHRLGYNETCANIANAMWNWRMLLATGESRYADMMETVLYNSMLSGVGVDGKGFYYNNPLRRHGDELPMIMRPNDPPLRSPILPCYCCPPNVSRTIAQLQGWAYSKTKDEVWVHLYGANTLKTDLAAGAVQLSQQTDYPWSGEIRFRVEQAPAGAFALRLRIPVWAEGTSVRVNGEAASKPAAGAYAEVRRTWKKGDEVALVLAMEPRLVAANLYVETTRNQVAVARGPVVYALESPDLPAGVRVAEVALPASIRLTPRHDTKLLGGVTVLEGQAVRVALPDWTGALYLTLRAPAREAVPLRLIPYYAWSNRGVSHMTVWMPVIY